MRSTTIVSIWTSERTRDEKYIVVSMESTVSSEMRYAPADLSKGFVVLARRERDVKYGGDHFDSRWVIRTNADGAKNYKLVTAPSDATLRSQWRDCGRARSSSLY